MNVGPTADGRIIPAFEERLLQMGQWLSVNGEAIYSSKPWKAQNDTVNKDVWLVCCSMFNNVDFDGERFYSISWQSRQKNLELNISLS